ncbi:MAG: hypothetical protein K2F91_02925, partial [Muribaculaceae bacterium]|nr:hypothetical protein [Muribaculaceae bacterium]
MKHTITIAAAALLCSAASAAPTVTLDYEAAVIANASTGDFAPYMIGSWNDGRIYGANGIWHDGRLEKKMTLDRRFNWGAGIEYMRGYGSEALYDRYDAATSTWGTHANRQ